MSTPTDQCTRCSMPGQVIELTRPLGHGSAWIAEYVCDNPACHWYWFALLGPGTTTQIINRTGAHR